MRFLLTESEALYIKDRYKFSQLLGLNSNQDIKEGTEEALKDKGIIYLNNDYWELSYAYRLLFSQWEKMQYSLVRPDINTNIRLQCLLCNNTATIFFDRNKDNLCIDMIDFSVEKLEQLFCALAELPTDSKSKQRFNISMSVEEYEEFISSCSTEEFYRWQKKLGIASDLLEEYVHTMNSQIDSQLLMVEDHLNDVGYMAKFIVTDKSIFAVKHVTYSDENEKIVMLLGDTQYIVDSIYNF